MFDPTSAMDTIREKYQAIYKLSREIDALVAETAAAWLHAEDENIADVLLFREDEDGPLTVVGVRDAVGQPIQVLNTLSKQIELAEIVGRFTEDVDDRVLEPVGFFMRALVVAKHLPRTIEV